MKSLVNSLWVIIILFFSLEAISSKWSEELEWAIRTAYLDKVNRLLADGTLDVNARKKPFNSDHKLGNTYLSIAVEHINDERIIEALLRAGADVNAELEYSPSILFKALSSVRNEKIIEILLKFGADTKVLKNRGATGFGGTVLHEVAEWGQNERVVQVLLDDPSFTAEMVNTTDESGKTALQRAMYQSQIQHDKERHQRIIDTFLNHPKVRVDSFELFKLAIDTNNLNRIKELIADERIDINARGPYNNTPVQYAAENAEDVRIIDAFLEGGADINAISDHGKTTIHYALKNIKTTGIVTALLRDPNMNTEGIKGLANDMLRSLISIIHNTLVPRSIDFKNNIEAVKELFRDGALNPNETDGNGRTLLHRMAEIEGEISTEIMKALIEVGADVHATDNQGRTPLHTAANIKNEKGIIVLLESGADITATDNDRRTPLHLLVRSRRFIHSYIVTDNISPKAVQAILEHPDFNPLVANAREDKYGMTPLQMAIWNPQVKNQRAIKMLLDNPHILPNKKNKDGETTFHLLLENTRSVSLIKMFLNHHRVDKNPTDSDGNTPFHSAAIFSESPQVIQAFLDTPEVNIYAINVGRLTPFQEAENAFIRGSVKQEILQVFHDHPRFNRFNDTDSKNDKKNRESKPWRLEGNVVRGAFPNEKVDTQTNEEELKPCF